MNTTVVNVKKEYLLKAGYSNLKEWSENPDNLYIGRDMSYYVAGAYGSKWQNPFKLKTHGSKSIELYKDYIINSSLYNDLEELQGKRLGCWCVTPTNNICHGNVLIELLKAKKKKN